MIELTEQLSTQTLEALTQLAKRCKNQDNNKIALYLDLLAKPRPKPSSVLLFNKNKLIGFASAFFFDLDKAEITLLIHPAHRRRHHAKTCLRALLDNITRFRPVPYLSFSVPHGLWKQALTQQGLTYQNSEYEMKYAGLKDQAFHLPQGLSIREATFDDMPILCELDQCGFPSANAFSEFRFETLLKREQHAIFLLMQHDRIIGKAHLTWDKKTAFLSDITIFPEMQKQGFGTTLISYCIDFSHKLPQTNIRLSVETHNKNALKLYSHLGFRITNAIDYWEGSFQTFDAQLQAFKWFPDSDKT